MWADLFDLAGRHSAATHLHRLPSVIAWPSFKVLFAQSRLRILASALCTGELLSVVQRVRIRLSDLRCLLRDRKVRGAHRLIRCCRVWNTAVQFRISCALCRNFSSTFSDLCWSAGFAATHFFGTAVSDGVGAGLCSAPRKKAIREGVHPRLVVAGLSAVYRARTGKSVLKQALVNHDPKRLITCCGPECRRRKCRFCAEVAS